MRVCVRVFSVGFGPGLDSIIVIKVYNSKKGNNSNIYSNIGNKIVIIIRMVKRVKNSNNSNNNN